MDSKLARFLKHIDAANYLPAPFIATKPHRQLTLHAPGDLALLGIMVRISAVASCRVAGRDTSPATNRWTRPGHLRPKAN